VIDEFVKKALAEDVGRGDLYAKVFLATPASAKVIAKSAGIVAGQVYCNMLAQIEPVELVWIKNDGDMFEKGDVLVTLKADSHTLLKIERTFLNMLLHASSIATLTHRYVNIVKPYGTKLLDTRKTRPMLRQFEKYATRIGGAINHRMGLDDALMLKDTHLKTIDDLDAFMKQARQKIPFTCKIEIEAESIDQAKKFMQAGADIVMCDNMTPAELETVIAYRNTHFPAILLEASGNISLETIEMYAKTGVDAISSGALIHQANWLDLSMKLD
jgi:nicotinate-nucleotide pyrophosphorylase (carboxylating)